MGNGSSVSSIALTTTGANAPIARPARTPSPAITVNWTRYVRNTTARDAPMHFSVAITPSRVSSQARTALPTPTPPTRSAVRPTRLRNEPSRPIMRWMPGAALS